MLKRTWLRIERCFLYHLIRLFRIRGASERVARGFAIGLMVNFFPTFGFGVLVSGFIARLFGGNAVAGFVGGALLAFSWPVLFYLNLRTGALLLADRAPVEDLDDVTERTIDAFLWGKWFTAGAIANCLLLGGAVYLLLRAVYAQVRPHALGYFRRHAVDHQRRFGRRRLERDRRGQNAELGTRNPEDGPL